MTQADLEQREVLPYTQERFSGEAMNRAAESVRLTLHDRFLIPPFSILDTRAGYWQDRKRQWLGLGIQSELGREEKLLGFESLVGDQEGGCPHCAGTGEAPNPAYGGAITMRCPYCQGNGKKYGGYGSLGTTSVFDPVLCEAVYRWFTPPGAHILDPFAGGSVRGIVAAKLERKYLGIDLSAEQCHANDLQRITIGARPGDPSGMARVWPYEPNWIVADARDIPAHCGGMEFDAIFSCPPYYDLEVYSDDPRDLSRATDYAAFRSSYREIIERAVKHLKWNRFACFVVADIRARDGKYVGLVPDTIRAFEDAGAELYNEAILVNALGSAPVRVSSQFGGGRKLGKTHQNVLVFLKGDAKRAAEECGPVPEVVLEQGGAVWHADGHAELAGEETGG